MTSDFTSTAYQYAAHKELVSLSTGIWDQLIMDDLASHSLSYSVVDLYNVPLEVLQELIRKHLPEYIV